MLTAVTVGGAVLVSSGSGAGWILGSALTTVGLVAVDRALLTFLCAHTDRVLYVGAVRHLTATALVAGLVSGLTEGLVPGGDLSWSTTRPGWYLSAAHAGTHALAAALVYYGARSLPPAVVMLIIPCDAVVAFGLEYGWYGGAGTERQAVGCGLVLTGILGMAWRAVQLERTARTERHARDASRASLLRAME